MAREKKQTVTQLIMEEVRAKLSERSHDLSRKQYYRDSKRFVKYCREQYDCRSFLECGAHIQDYSDFLKARNYSASTIHTYLAAVCSVFAVDLGSITKPIRYTADYVRGREVKSGIAKVDLNHPKWSYVVDFQRVVGIRRDELMHLKGKDFALDESGYPCVVVRRGKGGKPQAQRISEGKEEFVKSYFGKVSPDEYVFDRELFKNDLNFHSLRAESAKEYYYCQMNKIAHDPEYAQKLEAEIRLRWATRNHDKRGRGRHFMESEIRGYYYLRGKNRQLAKEKGLPLSYSKLALLATSIFKLSHWRNDVTVASYMLA